MLLRTDSLIGNLVNRNPPHPPLFSDVWQTKDFKPCVFGCVANKGVMGVFYGCVANAEVRGLEVRSWRKRR
jgi:hypothetical protein